jgi:hypothetical protein
VAIGTEHGYEPLSSCAVVVAPLSTVGMGSGAVGLLGPTRMDYSRALAAAHVVGQRLGERIGLGGPPDTPPTGADVQAGAHPHRRQEGGS